MRTKWLGSCGLLGVTTCLMLLSPDYLDGQQGFGKKGKGDRGGMGGQFGGGQFGGGQYGGQYGGGPSGGQSINFQMQPGSSGSFTMQQPGGPGGPRGFMQQP